jgi:hypothetical protein
MWRGVSIDVSLYLPPHRDVSVVGTSSYYLRKVFRRAFRAEDETVKVMFRVVVCDSCGVEGYEIDYSDDDVPQPEQCLWILGLYGSWKIDPHPFLYFACCLPCDPGHVWAYWSLDSLSDRLSRALDFSDGD